MKKYNDAIRQDLQTQITDVFASPGTLLVVHPRTDNVSFNPDFVYWLRETLSQIIPEGVKVIILNENATQFDVVPPSGSSVEYLQGWNDVIEAIS